MSGKVAILGAGSWGTAFSIVLADAGNDVTIWARRDEVAEEINERHENVDYLPGIELPRTIDATSDAEKDILSSYDMYANAYIKKPVDFDQFVAVVRQIDEFFVSVVILPPQ